MYLTTAMPIWIVTTAALSYAIYTLYRSKSVIREAKSILSDWRQGYESTDPINVQLQSVRTVLNAESALGDAQRVMLRCEYILFFAVGILASQLLFIG